MAKFEALISIALTPPSSGHPTAGFAIRWLPLMSNVGRHHQGRMRGGADFTAHTWKIESLYRIWRISPLEVSRPQSLTTRSTLFNSGNLACGKPSIEVARVHSCGQAAIRALRLPRGCHARLGKLACAPYLFSMSLHASKEAQRSTLQRLSSPKYFADRNYRSSLKPRWCPCLRQTSTRPV
jgi:hypothetical protein